MMSNLWGFYYCCCLWHHLYEISARTKTSRSTFAFALTFRYLIHFVLIHVYKMWMGQPHCAWILNCYTSHFWRGTAGTSVLQSLLLTGAHLPTQPQSVAGTRCHTSTEATIASHSEASLAGTSHSLNCLWALNVAPPFSTTEHVQADLLFRMWTSWQHPTPHLVA